MKKKKLMKERPGTITMKGKPLTLVGNELKVGDEAPDFEVVTGDLSVVRFSSFHSKVYIISSVPSLDTSVCDMMIRRFNQEAINLGEDVAVLIVSMDLPFAQKRWCGNANVKNLMVFSDHFNASFGRAFGVLIKELRLLARAVFLVDSSGIIRYIQVVSELSHEPDYEAMFDAVIRLRESQIVC